MIPFTPYLFGIDLDGTLLSPVGEVSDRTKAAIHDILEAGHHVCFATGRNFIEAKPVFASVEHEAFAVLVSGAMLIDTRTAAVLHRGHMNAELAAALCGAIEAAGETAVAFQDREETGVDYLYSAGKPLHRALSGWLALGQRVETRPAMTQIDHSKTLRVSTVCGYEAAARVRTTLAEQFGDHATLHSIVIRHEQAEIIEVFDPGVNKWQGVTRVADLYRVPHERIIAIGDDTNDLPMLRQATLGVAMGNARQEVKDVADRVIGRNEHDGLALFLQEWLRKGG